jgi:hypothetical protein
VVGFFVDDGNALLFLVYNRGEKEENMYFVVVNGFIAATQRTVTPVVVT